MATVYSLADYTFRKILETKKAIREMRKQHYHGGKILLKLINEVPLHIALRALAQEWYHVTEVREFYTDAKTDEVIISLWPEGMNYKDDHLKVLVYLRESQYVAYNQNAHP